MLIRKLDKYTGWWHQRRYRTLNVGLGLRPRLVILTSESRARRLVAHISKNRNIAGTISVAPLAIALRQPLSRNWWRSDLMGTSELCR